MQRLEVMDDFERAEIDTGDATIVIDLVRPHSPNAVIAVNTNPTDSLDAAQRWLACCM